MNSEAVNLLKMASNPYRMRLLALLIQDDMTMEQLRETAVLPKKPASRHLMRLIDQGLVTSRRNGRHCVYTFNPGTHTRDELFRRICRIYLDMPLPQDQSAEPRFAA